MADSNWRPLEGVRVLDFSMLLPGPVTTVILADLGADVVKVEPPGGDYARHMKSHMFIGANRNKRSIALDLKNPSAGIVVHRLAARSDIAIEGFRPGVADRLGFGATRLREVNPKLVFCSVSGFGQTGPLRTHPGHDLAYLALGGALAHKGQLREPPRRSAMPVADYLGGAYAAVAILAALRERDRLGRGTTIDLSLYESVLFSTFIRFGAGTPAESVTHLFPANDLFACRDGRQIALTIVEQKFWDSFVRCIHDVAPAFSAPEFATEEGRLEQHERLMAMLDELFATREAAAWVSFLEPHDVPVALCLTPAEALETEHARARAAHAGSPQGPIVPFPAFTEHGPVGTPSTPPPALGAHAREILEELEFDEAEIRELEASGAVPIRARP